MRVRLKIFGGGKAPHIGFEAWKFLLYFAIANNEKQVKRKGYEQIFNVYRRPCVRHLG